VAAAIAMKFQNVRSRRRSCQPASRRMDATRNHERPRNAIAIVTVGICVLITADTRRVADEGSERPGIDEDMIQVCLRLMIASWSLRRTWPK